MNNFELANSTKIAQRTTLTSDTNAFLLLGNSIDSLEPQPVKKPRRKKVVVLAEPDLFELALNL